MACGLQNAMCTMHLGAVVRTTHVTGTVTDLGSTSGRAVMILLRARCNRRNMPVVDRSELAVDLQKFKVLLVIFLSFMFGTAVGAKLARHLGADAFLVPASVTGVLGVLYTFFRETLKRQMKSSLRGDLREVQERVQSYLTRMREQKATHSHDENDTGDSDEDDEASEVEEELEHVLGIMDDLEEQLPRRQTLGGGSAPARQPRSAPAVGGVAQAGAVSSQSSEKHLRARTIA